MTPHNITLPEAEFGLDTDVDIAAGETVEVHLNPLWPDSFTIYGNKKLLFMESHREKGMEGKLIVEPSEKITMKVLLVSANRERIPDPIFPLGLAYMAAATKNTWHEIAVADLCFGRQPLANNRDRPRLLRIILSDCF